MKRLLDDAKSNSYNQIIDKRNAPAEDPKKALKMNEEQQELSIDNENVDGGQL